MADLPRKTLKVFGGNPEDPLIDQSSNTGIFGSRQAASGAGSSLSNNIEAIQNQDSGDRWEKGWFNATEGFDRLPPAEEMEGIHRVISYSAAYLLQKGIPEYDTGTTYFKGDIVRRPILPLPETFDLYASLTDTNLGNALPPIGTSNTNWKFLNDLDNPVGSLIDQFFFKTVGITSWPIPTNMTEKGYVDVIVVGGGSGAVVSVGNAASGVASSFGFITSSTGGTPGSIVGGLTFPNLGGIGIGGDLNIQGGSGFSGITRNASPQFTLSGGSGSSIFSGFTHFGSADNTSAIPFTGPVTDNFGQGGIVTLTNNGEIVLGGNGGGTSIKRIERKFLTSPVMIKITAAPSKDLTSASHLDSENTTVDLDGLTLRTKDLTANISAISSITLGDLSLEDNSSSLLAFFLDLDFTLFSSDISGILNALNSVPHPNLIITNQGNVILFKSVTPNTVIKIVVGSGGASIGANTQPGRDGLVNLKAFT